VQCGQGHPADDLVLEAEDVTRSDRADRADDDRRRRDVGVGRWWRRPLQSARRLLDGDGRSRAASCAEVAADVHQGPQRARDLQRRGSGSQSRTRSVGAHRRPHVRLDDRVLQVRPGKRRVHRHAQAQENVAARARRRVVHGRLRERAARRQRNPAPRQQHAPRYRDGRAHQRRADPV
ncbi:MAG: hypothetical protein AVDCRST_MAG67-4326, partial [uncultured Solirubrobacteraceae bacterium]